MKKNQFRGAPSRHDQLDSDVVERILKPDSDHADIPAEYAALAGLLRSAALCEHRDENESVTVSALAFKLRAPAPTLGTRVRATLRKSSLKVGLAAAVGVLSVSSVAAAATNNLPASTQSVVATAASHMGVDIPKPKSTGGSNATVHPSPQTCHLAQQQPNAHGCSAVAHASAPGQINKAPTSTTNVTTADAANNAGPAANGASHASTQGLTHGQGLQGSTTTSTSTPGKSAAAPGHQNKS